MARSAGIRWSNAYAARGLITVAPAAVATLIDVQGGAALVVGLMPVCPLPLPPLRAARLRLGLYGVLAAVALLLGGFVAQWPVVAVLSMVAAGAGLGRLVAVMHRPVAMLGLLLCLPLFAVGFSYPGTGTVGALALDILLGTVWSVAVAVAWPAPAPGSAAVPPAPHPGGAAAGSMTAYGLATGIAGALCATIGFTADLEHVGWATAAALLVMRPDPPTQVMRTVGRFASVVVGAAAAIVLVASDPPDAVYAVAVGAVGVVATATATSEWYILPTFTTFLVFVLLLARDVADAPDRFWERVLETALGLGVAALAQTVLALRTRRVARFETAGGAR